MVMELSAPVERAVEEAATLVEKLILELQASQDERGEQWAIESRFTGRDS
jgi:hypothetical protein